MLHIYRVHTTDGACNMFPIMYIRCGAHVLTYPIARIEASCLLPNYLMQRMLLLLSNSGHKQKNRSHNDVKLLIDGKSVY